MATQASATPWMARARTMAPSERRHSVTTAQSSTIAALESEHARIGGVAHLTTNPLTTPSRARTKAPASSSGRRNSRTLAMNTSKTAIDDTDDARPWPRATPARRRLPQTRRRRRDAPGGEPD